MKNSKQSEFTLLDGSRGPHISDSKVIISYKFPYQRAQVS
jgi:hypothetical protein